MATAGGPLLSKAVSVSTSGSPADKGGGVRAIEGINIFESGQTIYGGSTNQVFFAQEGSARYLAGVRFKF